MVSAAELPPKDDPEPGGVGPGGGSLCSMDGLLTVTEASTVAGVADETIRAWYDSGEITGERTARGHRLVTMSSLRRRLGSVTVGQAVKEFDCKAHVVREWFDTGKVTGFRTASGRRRIDRSSIVALLSDGMLSDSAGSQ